MDKLWTLIEVIIVMGPGRVNFLWLGSGRVGSAIYGLGLNLENFP